LEEVSGLGLFYLQAAGVTGIKVLQPEALAFGDPVTGNVLL
jgi:hypothetical protein